MFRISCFEICVDEIDIDIPVVSEPEKSPEDSGPSQVSKNVVRLMFAILIVLTLVAVYANIQRLRRVRIETVTFTAAASPTPMPTATPSASATPP
jgi:hypothetical protein